MFVPAKCPDCGKILKVDSMKKAVNCENCNNAFSVEDAVNNFTDDYFAKTKTTNPVTNINNNRNRDFVIEGGVLKKYAGESTDVIIPNNVVAIGEKAFYGLKIKSVFIPNSVTEIRGYAFGFCDELTSINIPDSVKIIEYLAFSHCGRLANVTLPNNENSKFHSWYRAGFEDCPFVWKNRNSCQYCGSSFNMFGKNKKCTHCGKPKDY